jgi:hypothetical protein
MTGLLAFLLPPCAALAGMRVNELLFGRLKLAAHGAGLRFAWGMGTGMLIFSQAVVFGAVAGINLAAVLAWTALAWGAAELVARARRAWPLVRAWRPRVAHLWWLALLPVTAALVLTGLLATVEGTLEYDALAFWVFKAKVMFLKQGAEFHAVHQNPLLTYAHWDYPLLVPGLYTLNYGLHGEVFEFTNKVWPFWMVIAFLIALLSVSRFFSRPCLLPVAVVTAVCFVRFTTYWIRMEGATIPMMFYTGLAALTATLWLLDREQRHLPGLLMLALAGCVSTKFEGAVNALVWATALAVILFRGGGWRERPLHVGLGAAALCVFPYALFRWSGPLPHPVSNWLELGLAEPAQALARLPFVALLHLGHRFFSASAFNWQPGPDGALEWAGAWDGWNTFVDEHTHLIAWGIVLLVPFNLWRLPRARAATLILSGVCLGTLLFISLVVTCLLVARPDWAAVHEFATFMVARYFYPVIIAWFVGLLVPWLLPEPEPVPTVATDAPLTPESNSTTVPASAPPAPA